MYESCQNHCVGGLFSLLEPKNYIIHDFKFESGAVFTDLTIEYAVQGTKSMMNREKSAMLFISSRLEWKLRFSGKP